MDACCHVAWGNHGKRDHSGMKMWDVDDIGPALRSYSLLGEFARDLGRLAVPTLPRRILGTVPTRLPRDIPLVRNRFLRRFRHNIFRRWCRWLRRLLVLHCLCRSLVCRLFHVRVVAVAGVGCLDCNLHDRVAVAAVVVAVEAVDSHHGLVVGHGHLLLLLWERSCWIVGEIVLLVGDIAGFVGIAGSEVGVADFEADIGSDHCRAELGVRMQQLWLVTRRMRALHWLRRRCHQVRGAGVWARDRSRGRKRMTTTMKRLMMGLIEMLH